MVDYDDAIKLSPTSAYVVIWRYLIQARAKNNEFATQELDIKSKALNQTWPYPIVELYLGRKTFESVLEAADSPDSICEAQFYIGGVGICCTAIMLQLKKVSGAAETTCRKSLIEISVRARKSRRLGLQSK